MISAPQSKTTLLNLQPFRFFRKNIVLPILVHIVYQIGLRSKFSTKLNQSTFQTFKYKVFLLHIF